ncbi:hypothetical protein ACTHQY_14875 [Rhodococcoides corynebacterioides]|uniref:hypothetical protein n=1 Tax=Rhodococcoides corynebacterioides TaxID=53972 RepID=UPI003F820562
MSSTYDYFERPLSASPDFEAYPAERYEQMPMKYSASGDELDAFGNRGDLTATQDAADLVFGAIFEGTAGKASLPQQMLDILSGGEGLGALSAITGDIPVVGDIVEALTGVEDGDLTDLGTFANLLFGRDVALASRVAAIENKIAVGAEYFDNFKRGDNETTLGSPEPGVVANWVQFGDGEPMGVYDQAAQVRRNALPDDGTRYARCPFLATSNDYRVAAVVHPRGCPPNPRTSLYGRCNADMTEGVYVDFFGDKTNIGRFTRSGLTMNRTQWKTTSRAYSNSSTPELRMAGTRYQVVIDDVVILDHVDTSSFPVDTAHRTSGFSLSTWTGILAVPQFSPGFASFSVRNNDMTAVQQATVKAETAQQTADNAVDTAVTEATNAATGAVAGAVSGAIAPVKNQVEAVQASVITFQEGLPLRPFSHSMTNSEMTFDRVLLQPRVTGVSLSGAVSSTSLGSHRHTIPSSGSNTGLENLGSHTHSDTFSASPQVSNATFVPAANTITAGFIRATWGGLRESFTFATGPVTSPCPMQVMIGRLDPTNGNVVILWVSAELTAVIGSGSGEFVVTIPDGVLIEDRETIFVGIHQYGSGGIRPLYGITLAGLQRDGLLHPAKPNTRFGRSTAMTAGTTLSAGSLDFSNDTLPWLGIGPSLVIPVPAPTAYYENFDGNVMPSALVYRGGIRAQVSNGVFVVSGSTDGEANYLYTRRLNRDDHAVESKLMAVNSRPSFLAVRSDSSGNRIVMAVNEDSVSIRRRDSSGATLASVSMAVAAGTTFRFSAVGNVYTASRLDANGQAVTLCQYVDSSNVLARGVDNRYVGIGVDRFFLVNSGGWDYLRAADYPDPE